MITIKELAELGQKYNLDIELEAGHPDFVFLRKYDAYLKYGATLLVPLKEFAEDPKAVLKSCSEIMELKIYQQYLKRDKLDKL